LHRCLRHEIGANFGREIRDLRTDAEFELLPPWRSQMKLRGQSPGEIASPRTGFTPKSKPVTRGQWPNRRSWRHFASDVIGFESVP